MRFNDTKIAFSSKSNFELKKAYWLFKSLEFLWLIKIISSISIVLLKLKFPIKKLIKNTLYAQFVGGENIIDSKKTVDLLFNKFNVGSILDYSVEGNQNELSFENCKQEIIKTIDFAKKNIAIPFCVFKITGLGSSDLLRKKQNNINLTRLENDNYNAIIFRVREICNHAKENKISVLIDAEESWIQDVIDEIAENMIFEFNQESPIVYNTIQLYRVDKLEYLKCFHKKCLEKNVVPAVKLVRGAYMEKENTFYQEQHLVSIIHKNKELTDNSFNSALKYCIDNHPTIAICCGTHNERSCYELIQLMNKKKIKNNNSLIFFAQLYGMSDHISFNLINSGYNVAKYVPYGKVIEVMPYLIRRAEENSSIKGQTGRELKLIKIELRRRKYYNKHNKVVQS